MAALDQAVHNLAASLSEAGSENLTQFISCFEPLTARTPEAKRLCAQAWSACDPNGNNLASLAECEAFVQATLIGAHGSGPGEDLFTFFRPSYIRAFNDAKDFKKDDGKVIKGTDHATADDFVSKGELRLFCGYLCFYSAMYDAFTKVDGGGEGKEGDDRKITLDEWVNGYSAVNSYGFVGLGVMTDDETASASFKLIDANGGGVVTLSEWCGFIKESEIAAGTAIGKMLAAEE